MENALNTRQQDTHLGEEYKQVEVNRRYKKTHALNAIQATVIMVNRLPTKTLI